MRSIVGYGLALLGLGGAMTLVTWGLVTWTVQNFSLATLWPFNQVLSLHPVHILAIGLVSLPIVFRWLASPQRQADLRDE